MPDIAKITKQTALEIYLKKNGLDPYIAQIKKEIDDFVPDTSTPKTRAEIASMAMKIAKSKVYLDGIGKDLVDRLKQQPKLVDAERRRVREKLDGWRDEVRAPLTQWENDERVRVETITERISAMFTLPDESEGSMAFEYHIGCLKNTVIDETFGEFMEQAATTKETALRDCGEKLARVLIREAEAEEFERLRLAQAERDRIENERRIAANAAAEATRIAEKKAAADAERAKAEADEKIRKIERQKERAKQEAAKAKERENTLKLEQEKKIQDAIEEEARIAEAKAAEETRIARAKAEDRDHRLAVVAEATESLYNRFAFLSSEQAGEVIRAILNDEIERVNLRF